MALIKQKVTYLVRQDGMKKHFLIWSFEGIQVYSLCVCYRSLETVCVGAFIKVYIGKICKGTLVLYMMVFEATYGQNIYTLAYIFTHFPGSLGRANCVYLNGPFLYTSRCRYSPSQMAPHNEPFYCCICNNNLLQYKYNILL